MRFNDRLQLFIHIYLNSGVSSVHYKGRRSPHGNPQWTLQSVFCPLRDYAGRRGRRHSLLGLKFSSHFSKVSSKTRWTLEVGWQMDTKFRWLLLRHGLWPCLPARLISILVKHWSESCSFCCQFWPGEEGVPSVSVLPPALHGCLTVPQPSIMEPWPLSSLALYLQGSSLT